MKGNILQGTARGRLGNVVAKVVHGKQIYSNYQPNVVNRDSPLQRFQRGIFKGINESYKEVRDMQKTEGFDFLYNLYSGASKTFRGIFFNFAQQAQRIGIDDANYKKVNLKNPLMVQNSINNLIYAKPGFIGNNDLFPNFVKDITMPTYPQYFGSDVPLDLSTRILTIGTTIRSPHYLTLSKDISLSLADKEDAIGLPKQIGLQEKIEDCGDWPYIYAFTTDLDSGADGLPYSEGVEYASLYYFWADKFGRLISSGGLERKGSPVTP